MAPSRLSLGILFGAALAILMLFLVLTAAAFPAADDYCYANKVASLGYSAAQRDWFLHWSGRYSSTALISAFGLASDILTTYSPALGVAQLVTPGAFFLFLWALPLQGYSWRMRLIMSLVAYLIFLTGLPDTGQYLYWAMGVADYGLGNVALLLLLAVVVNQECRAVRGITVSWLRFVLASLFAVVAVGTNELTLVSVLTLLMLGTALSLRWRRQSLGFWGALLGVAVIASGVSILAPGNLARLQEIAGNESMRPSALVAAALWLPWFGLRLAYWSANPALWVSGWLVLIASREWSRAWLYQDSVFIRPWLWVPAVWLGLLLGLTGIGFAINHYPLPERAESTLWILFLLGWYPSFVILAHYLGGAQVIRNPSARAHDGWVMLLVLSLVGAPNVVEACKDSYRGLRYWREMSARHAMIREAQDVGMTDLVVPSLSRAPRTLFTTEITTDPNNFRNACLAEYYGLRSIRLGAPHK